MKRSTVTASISLLVAVALAAGHASAQEVVGEKGIVGEKGTIGEKPTAGQRGIVGEKGRAFQPTSAASIPADISRLLQQPVAAVQFRSAALKLRQLPPELLAAQPAAADLGAPFRIEPGTTPQSGRRWYASHVSEVASGQGSLGLLNDASAPRMSGRFGLLFAVQPGYRYLVDCSVAHASEFSLSHTGLGPTANEVPATANAGLVSLVSAPVRQAGNAWVEFKATRSQSAAWQWRGCEITPMRAS